MKTEQAQLTAYELKQYLKELESEGYDLKNIAVNYRSDSDSDVEPVALVGEDLYDSETNSVLESILLTGDSNDK